MWWPCAHLGGSDFSCGSGRLAGVGESLCLVLWPLEGSRGGAPGRGSVYKVPAARRNEIWLREDPLADMRERWCRGRSQTQDPESGPVGHSYNLLLGRLGQWDCKIRASQGNVLRSCLKRKSQQQKSWACNLVVEYSWVCAGPSILGTPLTKKIWACLSPQGF